MSFWYVYLMSVGAINWISSLFFGTIILGKNIKNRVNQTFAVFCAFVGFYGFFYMLIFSPWGMTEPNALLFFQLASLFAIFIPATFLHFTNELLKLKKDIVVLVVYAISFFFAAFSFSNLFIKDVSPIGVFRYWANAGPLYGYYCLYTFLVSAYCFYLIFRELKQCDISQKNQYTLLLTGMVFCFIGAISNILLWYDINIPPFAAVLTSGYVWASAYAIITYRFMDVKFVLKKSAVHAISLIIIFLVVLPLKLLFFNFSLGINNLVDGVIVILILIFYPQIKEYSFKLAHKYFFSSLYNSQEVITNLNYQLRTTLETSLIYKHISRSLEETLYLQSFAIISYDTEKNKFHFVFQNGLQINDHAELPLNSDLFSNYIQKNKPITLSDLKDNQTPDNQKILDFLINQKIEILFPLNIKFKTIGLLALGKKESGDAYNEEDLNLLEIISGFSATILENSNLYNHLKLSKENLEGLLIMKRDFLRVINHQLNTPVSIIRMSLASIKDNTMTVNDGLPMIQAGLDRISRTLDDFWLAYEFEGQTLKITQAETDVLAIVNQEIEKKRNLDIVKARQLSIKKLLPDFPLPPILGNQKFLSHVISILLDNAIHYTLKGQIEIYFSKMKKKNISYLKIYFSDSGTGIKKEDQKIIYNKFIRGSNAQSIFPDGSGLGLYIAKKVIEASEGELKLEKSDKQGSIFSISLRSLKLPVSKAKEDKLRTENKSKQLSPSALLVKEKPRVQSEQTQIKALFIEKDENASEIFKMYLAKRGVDSCSCRNAQTALELSKTLNPNIILSEIIIPTTEPNGSINMLSEQGFIFLSKIKNDPKLKTIPVIIFTSLDTEADRQKAQELGASEYINSSYVSPEELLNKIRELLKK